MKYYEMLCVLPGTMTEEEIKSSVDTISQTIVKHSPENVTVEDMGKSRLAYPINHIRYGYFQLFRFNLATEKINQLEKDVRLLDQMLRISIAICDPNNTTHYKLALDPTAPSAVPKPEYEERGRARHHEKENKKEDKKESTFTAESAVSADEEKTESTELPIEPIAKEVPTKEVEKNIEEKEASKTAISVEEIDKKLDEILQDDIMDKV